MHSQIQTKLATIAQTEPLHFLLAAVQTEIRELVALKAEQNESYHPFRQLETLDAGLGRRNRRARSPRACCHTQRTAGRIVPRHAAAGVGSLKKLFC